jgi:hypothetical protein
LAPESSDDVSSELDGVGAWERGEEGVGGGMVVAAAAERAPTPHNTHLGLLLGGGARFGDRFLAGHGVERWGGAGEAAGGQREV